ncbi:hypothetical protein FRC20_002968 [Serendipita sp. 405]|nr:hypothetical protein FRC15_002577 [Serendipita sp. 397]KAG8868696.1 hypothetical protein FRC20_002968 [Serendipita sp. 405]
MRGTSSVDSSGLLKVRCSDIIASSSSSTTTTTSTTGSKRANLGRHFMTRSLIQLSSAHSLLTPAITEISSLAFGAQPQKGYSLHTLPFSQHPGIPKTVSQ